jgi:ABC-type nitrate/sulfonate/bicarbonate transport system substrate-binding protein
MAMGGFRALATTAGVFGLLLLSRLQTPAMAETKEVRFAQLYSLTYLPAYIVYEEKLIEKNAARLGIPAPKVTISKLSSGPAANDALISGNVDIAMGGITVLLTLWEKTRGTMNVRGVATLSPTRSPWRSATADIRRTRWRGTSAFTTGWQRLSRGALPASQRAPIKPSPIPGSGPCVTA